MKKESSSSSHQQEQNNTPPTNPPPTSKKLLVGIVILSLALFILLVDFRSPVAKEIKKENLNPYKPAATTTTDEVEEKEDKQPIATPSSPPTSSSESPSNDNDKIPSTTSPEKLFELFLKSGGKHIPDDRKDNRFTPFDYSILRSNNQSHQSRDYCFQERNGPKLRKENEKGPYPTAQVREFLKNIVIMHMVSPTRYNLVPLMYKHYLPYFSTHQIFTGPKDAKIPGVPELDDPENTLIPEEKQPAFFNIEGHDVVAGTMQYVALANVIERLEKMSKEERISAGLPADTIEGYIFLGDDLILQPWNLYGRNKKVVWASGMGVANAENWKPVAPVRPMAMERKRLKGNWPFWFKGRIKMVSIYNDSDIDQEARDNVLKAFALTPPAVLRESRYADPDHEFCCSPRTRSKQVFYTIVDNFYVPGGKMALKWAKYVNVMKKYWLHLETAIPTALRMVSPSYEVLRIQYYWNTVSAAACSRKHWSIIQDGIHRCRHDHVFAQTIYDTKNMTDERRMQLATAATHEETVELRSLVGLDDKWNPRMKSAPKEFDARMKK